MKRKSKYTKEIIEECIKNCVTYADALRNLGLKPSGGNHRHLKALITKFNIDVSHIKGQSWSKGLTKQISNKIEKQANSIRYSDEEVFVKNSTYQSSKLKERLKKYKEYKCDICFMEPIWNNKPLTLHVDHIDGDHTNNTLENLHFLCPNCHQQTQSWGNKKLKLCADMPSSEGRSL